MLLLHHQGCCPGARLRICGLPGRMAPGPDACRRRREAPLPALPALRPLTFHCAYSCGSDRMAVTSRAPCLGGLLQRPGDEGGRGVGGVWVGGQGWHPHGQGHQGMQLRCSRRAHSSIDPHLYIARAVALSCDSTRLDTAASEEMTGGGWGWSWGERPRLERQPAHRRLPEPGLPRRSSRTAEQCCSPPPRPPQFPALLDVLLDKSRAPGAPERAPTRSPYRPMFLAYDCGGRQAGRCV